MLCESFQFFFFKGHILSQSVRREDFGGRDLTIYLQQLLNNKGCSMITTGNTFHFHLQGLFHDNNR
jgi:hypothetical protein